MNMYWKSRTNDIVRAALFLYPFMQKEGVFMYDNDEMLLNILDDDCFPIEEEEDDE